MKVTLLTCVIGLVVLCSSVHAGIKIKCPEGYHIVTSKKPICTCEPLEPLANAGSLIFVLDSTNSTAPSINAVKNGIRALAHANKIFRNYVVNHFNDPYEKNVKVTTSPRVIEEYLDEVWAFGGGDCPEPSLQASIDALEAAHDNSILLLITDANPKDAQLKDKLLDLLRTKKSRMYTIVTGDLCAGDPDAELKYKREYHELALKTFAKVAILGSPEESVKFMKLLQDILVGKVSLEAFPSNRKELEDALAGRCRCHYEYFCQKNPTPVPPPTPAPTKNPCKENEIAVKKTCPPCPSPPPNPKRDMGSLIFVIDTTQSMDNTITQVKNGVAATVALNKKFKNYVVVTYNDNDETNEVIEDKIKTTSSAKIQKFLANTEAGGGGDCPEPSMHAMTTAVNLADENSVLFLFTDATARDYKLEPQVTELMRKKKVVPYIVIVGMMCTDSEEEKDKYHNEYHTMTKALGGTFMKFDNDQDVVKVMEFIQKAVNALVYFENIGKNANELNKSLVGSCNCKEKIDCIPKNKCPEGAKLVTVTDLKTKTVVTRCLCPNGWLTSIFGKCKNC